MSPQGAVCILGAGSLGTSFATGLWRSGRRFSLWTIEDDVADSLKSYQENVKYLPGVKIPRDVRVTTDLEQAMHEAGIVILTVPSHVIREVSQKIAPLIADDAILVGAAKGLERGSLLRMSQVIAEVMPDAVKERIVVLSGPSLAGEVANMVPTGVDAASTDPEMARFVKAALQMKKFRMKVRRDVPGVEAGGTFKNLYAIGAGICDGLSLGNNTKASLMTRALSEMILFARKLGGKASTLHGLSGFGDLVVTCTSARSRNRTLGEALGKGQHVSDISRGMASVTEGVDAAHCAHELAQREGLRVPLADTILQILNGEAKPDSIIKVALP